MTAEIHHLPVKELTEEQEAYWWEQLDFAERKVEYAKRMLGLRAIDQVIDKDN